MNVRVVAGGIIPKADGDKLKEAGVAAIFTPKDYELTAMLAELAGARLQPALGAASAGARPADAPRPTGSVHSSRTVPGASSGPACETRDRAICLGIWPGTLDAWAGSRPSCS
jgi:hypothetical protein